MINLTKEQLVQLQKTELELLLEFDRICRKHNIKYSITGGTLLGAVRHGGFIPWDDDADVSMLRAEYEKFTAVVDKELNPDKFYYQDIERTQGYRWGYGKLRRKDSLFLREFQEHMEFEQGIFLDIFPRDSVPDGIIAQGIHSAVCYCIRKSLWSIVGRYASKNVFLRSWYSFLYHATKKWIKKAYYLIVRCSHNPKTKYVRNLMIPVPNKMHLREWYDSYTDIQFEGYSLMAEHRYLEWLKNEFGDYMQLPPIEKRKVHPVVAIKFPESGN